MSSNCCVTYPSYSFDGAAVLYLNKGIHVTAINLLGATVVQGNGFFVITDLRNNTYNINDDSAITYADAQNAITAAHSGGAPQPISTFSDLIYNGTNSWRNTVFFPAGTNIRDELGIRQLFVRLDTNSYLVFDDFPERDFYTANNVAIGMKINDVLIDPADYQDNATQPRIFIRNNSNILLRATFPAGASDGDAYLTDFEWFSP